MSTAIEIEEQNRGELTGGPGHADLDESIWGRVTPQFDAFARNVSMNYIAMAVQMAVGLLMLPFNVARLGQSDYGLWVLASSITMYFSILDLGYGVAQVKFAAEYRARRDHHGLNQIASTLFVLFSAIGCVVLGVAAIIAFNLEGLFSVTPEQATTGRYVLLIISCYVAVGFPFSVFGGVVNGFQRHYLNGGVSITTTIAVALVNIAVLVAGCGLVQLVAATTTVRLLSFIWYRRNAYRAFPGLQIRPSLFRLSRLRQVTGFSIFLLLIDLANKMNYSTDTVVIGAFLGTIAVSVWAVAQRLVETTQTLTTQVNAALFPVVVDTATLGDAEKLRRVLIQGTRISLAMVVPIATGLVMLAGPLVAAWVGAKFEASIPVIYVLAAVVTVRVGCSMATTLLKGAHKHRLLAWSNIGAAVFNIALSIALVHRFGLIGVAVGTLVPLGFVSAFVLFPAACRRADLPLWRALSTGVWPSLWPMIPMGAFLALTREFVTPGLIYVGAQAVAGGGIYLLVFFWLAIRRDERSWYEMMLKQLVKRIRPAAIAQES